MSTQVVVIPSCLAEQCQEEASRHYPLESGGAFMGRRTGTGHFFIQEIIGPGPKAYRSPYSFQPDAEWQWSEIARIYSRDNGTTTFLGDWHSHPQAAQPKLSSRDKGAVREILESPDTHSDQILSAIWAGGPENWSPQFWNFRIKGGRFHWPSLQITSSPMILSEDLLLSIQEKCDQA